MSALQRRRRVHMRRLMDVLVLAIEMHRAAIRTAEADPAMPPRTVAATVRTLRAAIQREEQLLLAMRRSYLDLWPGPWQRLRDRLGLGNTPRSAAAGTDADSPRAGDQRGGRPAAPHLRLVGGTAATGAGTHNPSSGPTGPEVA